MSRSNLRIDVHIVPPASPRATTVLVLLLLLLLPLPLPTATTTTTTTRSNPLTPVYPHTTHHDTTRPWPSFNLLAIAAVDGIGQRGG